MMRLVGMYILLIYFFVSRELDMLGDLVVLICLVVNDRR